MGTVVAVERIWKTATQRKLINVRDDGGSILNTWREPYIYGFVLGQRKCFPYYFRGNQIIATQL